MKRQICSSLFCVDLSIFLKVLCIFKQENHFKAWLYFYYCYHEVKNLNSSHLDIYQTFIKKILMIHKKMMQKKGLIWQSCSKNPNVISGTVLTVCLHHPDAVQHSDALTHSAKDSVLPIQPLRGRQREEELTPVGVWSSVSHR